MIWFGCLSLAAAILILLIHLAYRRQVKNTCRHLSFILEEDTNFLLPEELPFKEWQELLKLINGLLEKTRSSSASSLQKETILRETITNLSHDIRTPLTSLDGYFQLLKEAKTKEEQDKYTAIIQSRIYSLKDMLEELFTYAKLQDLSYELPLEETDFGECVRNTIFSFYDECKKKKIEPEVDFCEDALPILSNKGGVERAIQNIVKNALEHGSEHLSFSLYQKDGLACFCCENSLENPEDLQLDQVFSRFYKADQARSHTSTGLGLSIAKELVEKSGGTIDARQKENFFSITIRFPVK